MGRKYIDCNMQDAPDAKKCSASLSAETEEELLEAVIKHGINVHGLANTAEFREKVRSEFRDAP
jgi:predicted small metal-binding protein